LDYNYTYLKMDKYLQRTSAVSGTQWNGTAYAAVGAVTTTLDYDVNGRLVQTYDNNNASQTAEQFLVNDNTGHIVLKVRNQASPAMNAHVATGTYNPNANPSIDQQQGVTLGTSVPFAPTRPSPFATAAVRTTSWQHLRFANDQRIATEDASNVYSSVGAFWGVQMNTSWSFAEAFGCAKTTVNENTGNQYTWLSGDTLHSVAQSLYGDANLWYVIADANGLAEDSVAQLSPGTVLRIPTVTRSSNTASTYQPFDPSKIIGNTNPTATAPQPPPPPRSSGGGCGVLGTLLVIVVAVVATVVTAGAAAVAMGAVTSGTGLIAAGTAALTGGAMGATLATTAGAGWLAAGAAAIGGAVGSIASQGVAIATGMQQDFSWNNVALGALGAAVGSAMGGGAFKGLSANEFVVASASAATGNAVTQGVAVATGLQDQFDWRAVATSAIAAPIARAISINIGEEIGKALDGNNGVFTRTALGIVNGVVSQTIRMNVYNKGKLDYASIASDAFGNALGGALVDSMSRPPVQQDPLGDFINQQDAAQAQRDSVAAAASGMNGQSNSGDAQRFDDGASLAKQQGRQRWQAVFGSDWSATETAFGANAGDQMSAFANDVAGRKMANDPGGLKAAWTSARIDDFIAEAQANKSLPFTGNLSDSEKAELYTRMYRPSASPDALTAFDNGEKVIFGLRNETAWNANAGRGVFDDRVVVLQRGEDGKSVLHYEGAYNTEPAGSYDQKSPNFGVARTSTSPGSDKDVNNDHFMDAGRLIGNKTYEYEWSKGGSSYGPAMYGDNNVLRSVYSLNVERDVQHNGTYSYDAGSSADVAGKYDSGKTILFHRGYSGFTGSAGCQTFPVGGFANFAASIAPTPSQSRFFYTLKNM
jgi:hypothetical protein